jgi:CDP-4-dehydro-6-deoxyglucose reductase/3-phenylpropionate/trans-cinnamate dioxygenase ferredoxin reductase subunit
VIHTIRVQHTNVSFPCDSEQTVLDAAERAGYVLPYSCRKGVCSTCAGTLAAGELRVRGRGIAIGPRKDVLLCQARPDCDVVIVPSRIRSAGDVTRKTLQATVHRIETPAADVVVLQLRFANGIRAPFKAGQHLRVSLADGSTRNYSMANSPGDNDGVQLHIRRVAAGSFSDRTLSSLRVGNGIRVELPFGEVWMDMTLPLRAVLLREPASPRSSQ